MEAQLIEFFSQQEWSDAELRVLLSPSSIDCKTSTDVSACQDQDGSDGSGDVPDKVKPVLLRLPVHRILLSRSEVFKAQV
jgi:hypothetical protein